MINIKLLSLFSGIGAYERALQKLNVTYDLVNYCEFNKVASHAYSLIHNVSEDLNLGDITKVDETIIDDFDLMTYSFPCIDLSMLGNMSGLRGRNGELTKSGLFFDAMRIAAYKKPKYMIAENVRSLASKKFSSDFNEMKNLLDSLGYNTYSKVLNSKDFGIPHSRNRIFIVSIRKDIDDASFNFPDPIPLEKVASDYYDDSSTISADFYLRESDMKYCNEFRLKKKYSSINSDIIVCQTTKQGTLSNPQNFVKDEKGHRMLTSRETMVLQGFEKTDADLLMENGINKSQIGAMLGNSITVDVLIHIFKNLLKLNN